MARKKFPTSKRASIWRAHECRCVYCTELVTFADLDVDHIIPNHLRDRPEQFSRLLDEYGLNGDFEVDGLLNLVPSHRHCNLQKGGKILSKSRTIHFLSIAERKYSKALKIEAELIKQVQKDSIAVLLQVALEQGRLSQEELNSLMTGLTEYQNLFEVLTSFPFVDSELIGFLSSKETDFLYDRPILPRCNGLDKLNMIKGIYKVEVRTCREWAEASRDGYYALTTYDLKEEAFFKRVYSLIVALAQAKIPKYKYISDQKVSIANFDLLPVTLLPVLSSEGVKELKRFESEGIHISDLINQGRVKIVSSSPLSLTLHYDYMGLNMKEILRADLNDDGIEELLIGSYEWALGGTYGAGSTLVLARMGKDQNFTLAKNIELDV